MKTTLLQNFKAELTKTFTFVCLFFLTVAVSAQISFQGATSGSGPGNSSKKITFQHTVTSLTNFLVVTVTAQDKSIRTVSFGQQVLTEAITVTRSSMRVAIYYLASPTPGTDLITVETNSSTDIAAVATNYGNVILSNPIIQTASASGKSTAASLSILSINGDRVVDGIGTVAINPTNSNNQTLTSNAGGSHPNASSFKSVTSSTTTTNWTLSGSSDWGMVGIVLKGAQSGTPLPIKLTNFDAKYNKPNVELTWSTEQEINFSHFIVEKSTDGINFKEVSFVFGAGNSNAKINYQFTDKTIGTGGVVYYRLKSIDKDEKYTYSITRVIRLEEAKEGINVTTFPNPVANELRITIPATWQHKKVVFELYSANGQAVSRTENANSSQTETINVNRLSPGMYLILVKCNGATAQQRIIKH